MRFIPCLKPLLASIVIMAMVACAPTAKREGAGEYVDDALITTKVKTALAADPDVKATEVKVETFKGTVQLSGFVSSPESIQKAISIARGVGGVRSVKNDMVVK
ncbi:MAG: BON domain-containing protein [Massilia sp.]|nr:BON domain-containing protein [Massilia sp.]